jgi:hypothetical protein
MNRVLLELSAEISFHSRPPGDDKKTPVVAVAMLTVKFRQPSHDFTFGVGMSSISYPLVLTPLI